MAKCVLLAGFATLFIGCGPCGEMFGDEPPETADNARGKRLLVMRDIMKRITVSRITDDGAVAVELVPDPLLRFSDLPRGCEDSTTWAWGKKGRPVALMSLESYPTRRLWGYSLASLCEDPLDVDCGGGWRWTPKEPGFLPAPVGDGPIPAEKASERLHQMREIARRFEAHEFWERDHSRFELRLLSQPVLRYEEQAKSILDGAIFIFSYGTNPEVALVLEVTGSALSNGRWSYALVRQGNAEMHVTMDGREVWQCSLASSPTPRGPYWNFGRSADTK